MPLLKLKIKPPQNRVVLLLNKNPSSPPTASPSHVLAQASELKFNILGYIRVLIRKFLVLIMEI
jgi:hypothetical protein